MGGTGVIDRFLGIFTQYIDSGFGLIQGDVRWLAGVLIAIDITLAGLFWAFSSGEEVLARLIKKTLYIGVFAFIIGNYNNLAAIIFSSFAGLGLQAVGTTLSAAQVLQPATLAHVSPDDVRRWAAVPGVPGASRSLDLWRGHRQRLDCRRSATWYRRRCRRGIGCRRRWSRRRSPDGRWGRRGWWCDRRRGACRSRCRGRHHHPPPRPPHGRRPRPRWVRRP